MRKTEVGITAGTFIPDLLGDGPQVRPVLDRYGLRGCGGPRGPVETLEFFAKAHEVPLDRLLAELETAAEVEPASAEPPTRSLADQIYRPFFLAGMAVVLTFGALWGAYLLLRIGLAGKFQAAGLHEVNAHGHAQIFGWVGLFVMGFAYQAFPRFKHTSLAWPGLALATLVLMLAGIVGRSAGEPLVGTWAWAGPLAVGASVVEVVAIALFVAVLIQTWRRTGKGLAFYDGYILSALAWFVLQAVYETAYLAATLAAADHEQLISLVRTWQPALREMQIHGFATLMVLGVSQRLFHNFYVLPAPGRRLSLVALVLLNVAVAGEVLGLVLMETVGRCWAALWYGGVLLFAAAVAALLCDWRIFSRPAEGDRSLKFLRAAYVWLLASLCMAVLLPAYQYAVLPAVAPESEAARLGFSHAYYGAVRHAATVGFLSLMIMGVAAKVVPTLNGIDVRALSPLWAPFLLLNIGCALRVGAQTLTDVFSQAFPLAGISGLFELTGLALWAVHLGTVMVGRARLRQIHDTIHQAYDPGQPLAAHHRVGEVPDRHPELVETFVSLRFRPLANPLLRRTLAHAVTIDAACRRAGLETCEVLAVLNEARAPAASGRRPLTVLP
jgi:hypothetical protein